MTGDHATSPSTPRCLVVNAASRLPIRTPTSTTPPSLAVSSITRLMAATQSVTSASPYERAIPSQEARDRRAKCQPLAAGENLNTKLSR